KFCTTHSLLHEEAPGFVVAQAFGGGQPQVLRDLRPIHVTLMAEVEEGRIQLCWRWWGNGFGVHPGIIPRMVRQRYPRNAPAASGRLASAPSTCCPGGSRAALLRDRRPGGLRRDRSARETVPGADQGRREVAEELVRGAR